MQLKSWLNYKKEIIYFFIVLCVLLNVKSLWSKEIKILLLPFDNYSSDPEAFNKIRPLIVEELQKKGFEIYNEAFTKEIMNALEIKERGYLLKKNWDSLHRKYAIRYILTGSILKFSSERNPKVALHMRLIDLEEEEILWSNFISQSGEDFETFFGLGKISKIENLAKRVVSNLLKNFALKSITSTNQRIKIALLPFKNLSDEPFKGKAFSYIILTELTKLSFLKVLELGEIIENIQKIGILPKGEITYKEIEEFQEETGANYIIIGAVEEWWEEGVKSDYPKILISLRVLNSSDKKIVFATDKYFTGIEKEGILERGKLRTIEQVAEESSKEILYVLKKIMEGK